MTSIGLMSDTHDFLDPLVFKYFADCDEVWHAGDIGDLAITDTLEGLFTVRAVYGNVDNEKVRATWPLDLHFQCEGVKVWMTHIGGYPGRYKQRIREQMRVVRPDLFICGHSHILKIIYDKQYGHLHMNPGACGNHGFHQVKTLIRFKIDGATFHDVEVIELGKRGALPK